MFRESRLLNCIRDWIGQLHITHAFLEQPRALDHKNNNNRHRNLFADTPMSMASEEITEKKVKPIFAQAALIYDLQLCAKCRRHNWNYAQIIKACGGIVIRYFFFASTIRAAAFIFAFLNDAILANRLWKWNSYLTYIAHCAFPANDTACKPARDWKWFNFLNWTTFHSSSAQEVKL